ncbi:MAG: thiamine diphosphokinase [Gorillibacterium sp.]|nr:thiamine diphosphokinase [Gorillibacterium sp.]
MTAWKNKQNATGRIIIFSGGSLEEWALREVREGDFLIGADRGALFLIRNGLTPDLSIGDYDSVTPAEKREIHQASREFEDCDPVLKDYTDTEMAIERALAQNPNEILLVGVLGTRFDHSLANVQLLVKCHSRGVPCRITDNHNEILIAGPGVFSLSWKSRFSHVSLLPLTQKVTGITLTGFRYPLQDATLTMGQSLGISNVLEEPSGSIETAEGLLLVIQSVD